MKIRKYYILFIFCFIGVLASDFSRCLEFNGENNYVIIDHTPLNVSRRFTIECWFNAHTFIDGAAIIDNGTAGTSGVISGYSICTADSNRIVIRMGNGSEDVCVQLDSITANVWQHLAVTYDKYKNDENIVVFLNGKVIKKVDCKIILTYPDSFHPYGLNIGGYRDDLYKVYFDGMVDELRIWNVVRNNTQIRAAMDSELDSLEIGLQGYYTFNHESGGILEDFSESENHGLLVNMPDSCWKLSYAHLMALQPNDVAFRRIVLAWGSSPGFTSFTVDLSEESDFSSSLPGFPLEDISTSYYIIDDIEPGSYYYRVKGHFGGEDPDFEPWSNIQFTATVTDVATPITLSHFSAEVKQNKIHITWQTESQTENALFVLQRSENEGKWQTINRQDGAGTNNVTMSYDHIDRHIIPGEIYKYRLQNISFSGEIDSSAVCSIRLPEHSAFLSTQFDLESIYPNPFNPRVKIRFMVYEQNDIHIEIYSLQGTCIDVLSNKKYEPGIHTVNWEPQNLATGIYVLRIWSPIQSNTHKLLHLK